MTGENGSMYMPVAPAYGNNDGGMFGGNWMWFLLVWMAMFGWGGNGGFGGYGSGNSAVQRGFDQNAIMNGLNDIQQNVQNSCCENRLATANLQTVIAQESAATRANCDANSQKVMDKLCQLELDGIKQNYEGQLRALQNQLAAEQNANQALRFAASQGAQTAQILANNEAQTTAIEQYLAPVPRPAYIVQNPNCCQGFGYNGCGGFAG